MMTDGATVPSLMLTNLRRCFMLRNLLQKVIAFSMLIFFLWGCNGGGSLQKVIHDTYGYNYEQPPSVLHGPGTIVVLKSVTPFQLKKVCGQEDALGENVPLDDSPTMSADLSKLKDTTFTFTPIDISKLNAKLGGKYLKKITMSLKNVKIIELKDTVVHERAGQHKFTQPCVQAIFERIQAAQPITMISSVIQADVVYNLQYDAALDVQLKAELTKNLAPELGINASSTDIESLKGEKLYWGILDDKVLLSALMRQMPGMGMFAISEDQKAGTNRRLIPPGVEVTFEK